VQQVGRFGEEPNKAPWSADQVDELVRQMERLGQPEPDYTTRNSGLFWSGTPVERSRVAVRTLSGMPRASRSEMPAAERD
jgi:hypothetical protein